MNNIFCKAILFDLDGVLVDACEWHYIALNKALKSFNYPEITEFEHKNIFNGLPTLVKLKLLKINEELAKKINEKKQKITIDIINEQCHIMKEKIELHKWLKENKIKIGCITNSIRNTAELMLKNSGQYNYIDLLITNEDVKNNKPNPECYNLAVNKLDIHPKQILCVEDSDKGIEAVKSSAINNLLIVKNSKDVNLKNIKTKLEEINNENINTNGR